MAELHLAAGSEGLAALRRLEERQTALLERICIFPCRVHVAELEELELRQSLILSQIAAVSGRLREDPSGATSRREILGKDGGRREVDQDGRKLGEEIRASRENNARSQIEDGVVGVENLKRAGDGNGGKNEEKRLGALLTKAGATFSFKRVGADYYSKSFDERKRLLGAASIDHLCKSIVMVNTQAQDDVKDSSDRKNSKFYVIVVQYIARLNAEKVRQFLYSLNNGKIPKKRFNMRLAPEEESNALTGFEHNAVTPFGMLTDIPVSDINELILPELEVAKFRLYCRMLSPNSDQNISGLEEVRMLRPELEIHSRALALPSIDL